MGIFHSKPLVYWKGRLDYPRNDIGFCHHYTPHLSTESTGFFGRTQCMYGTHLLLVNPSDFLWKLRTIHSKTWATLNNSNT